MKYIDGKRLTQYIINKLRNKIKSNEKILSCSKTLLEHQKREIKFHIKELQKKEEKEELYNHFKRDIRERFIHKNLKIDAVCKISTKLAYFGRKYFLKNYDYINPKDKDDLFGKEIKKNFSFPKKKFSEYFYKAQSSCGAVIDDIEKIRASKNELIKRIKLNEEKNNYKNLVENFNLDRSGSYRLINNYSIDENGNLVYLDENSKKRPFKDFEFIDLRKNLYVPKI